MDKNTTSRIIIVEGRTDRDKLRLVLDEPVEIICTNGTLGDERLEQLLAYLEDKEAYLLADADSSGAKLRQMFNREFPQVHHLYTQKMYREVAATPEEYLAQILAKAHFAVKDRPPRV
ncbi:Toprim domain protein [Acididesulfobacillus acetoxydans]|uniref:Toprim domain n=1 Tax=Acididesulfobacillus acetoxydans TaxID=1561005 RepID=A0A8S0Y355_9FIRM|nr:toprim domain-containing protein [Acididesulfobacillus acetoxydans]CAA7601635.1 Toprim domain protein [Acididesulfobacillus acetoxydans]CEJ07122.1 Toprim domain [Acididesulfobacillus acetoxydans]